MSIWGFSGEKRFRIQISRLTLFGLILCVVYLSEDVTHVRGLALAVFKGQRRLLWVRLGLVLEVLELVVIDIDLVGLVLRLLLLLLLAELLLWILVVISCFAALAKELGGHGLCPVHLLLFWFLLATWVLVLVLDATLDAELLHHAVVNDAARLDLLVLDLGGPVMDVKHFLVERFLEKLVVVEGMEVVVERSGLVLVVYRAPL